jgi:hypothetical protein
MRIEHATLDGEMIVTDVPDEPILAEPVEPAAPSIENLGPAVQVIAERVGMIEADAETLVQSTRGIAALARPPDAAGAAPT